ncbi:protein Mp1R-MYB14 [Marchantia polymorpha subsp. ruderalis]|uniref:Myb-like domain-containing protein n=1 Tax=Marchantia polymorpha TaxID=3197 RepID=A0A2R6WM67_MARPO|nr:hypothetical protein MARPO_0075s0051 [Marchantia polymorpha]BBN00892.1 hypothetical protein Mp_2g02900 [Marchantia polymorpha subsp. ruderalis]|eukprot:PTQ34945.1 hypothetical protein MARPO_0075s0051 [Marchantia polymorpha]
MGAGAGAAAAIENEPSPRRAAIEKAQAELRREVAVREERRRELEFLEKGGELLDFFSAANFALPPSSPTDPLADQLLSSEGEGGHASVALTNGDSVENSVGTSLCVGRSSEGGGDLCPGEDFLSAVIEPLTPWEGKGRASRTGSTSLRSHSDVNLKRESEGSGGGRAAVKGQAYSRRNRPRSNRFGNGHTPTRDVEKAGEVGVLPSIEIKGSPAPPVIFEEVTEENETMVDKKLQVLPAPTLLYNSHASTQLGPVTTKVIEDLEATHLPTGKSFEQNSVKAVHAADDALQTGREFQIHDLAASSCGSLQRSSDLREDVCTGIVVKDELVVVGDLKKVDQTSLSPHVEKNVDSRDGGAVSQPSEQVLGNNQAASDKACGLPSMVEDESAIVMIMDESLGSRTSKNECKDKSTVVSETKGDRVIDRSTIITKHGPDSMLTPTIDDKTSVLREVSCTMQLTPKSLDTSENKSIISRKTTSTASSGAPDLIQNDKARIDDPPSDARVEVKVEEGLSEVGTRLSTVDTQVESGHDVKSICVVSLPQEEIKSESQSTPVSAGSNRAGFRTPNSNTASINKFPGVVLPWEKERDPNVRAEAERHKADLSAKARKAHEDYILEEAEIIKKSKKDTAEWAKRSPHLEPARRKSHWDYLLQEMAWMANDFMQERLWKLASATQFCRWIAEQRGQSSVLQLAGIKQRQERVARVLANAINEFWRSVEYIIHKDKRLTLSSLENQESVVAMKEDSEAVPMDVDIPSIPEGSTQRVEKLPSRSRKPLPVQNYAIRFLKESMGSDVGAQAEAPCTPERISEANSVLDPLWEDQFPEEPLFYLVPDGASRAYRILIETERSSLEIEHEQTLHDHAAAIADAEAVAEAAANADFNVSLSVGEGQPLSVLSSPMKGLRAEEDELGGQFLPNALSSIAKKKRKNILKSNASKGEGISSSGPTHRPPIAPGLDSTAVVQSPLVTGKRSLSVGPGNIVGNVGSIPTKRMRSVSSARQRVMGTASPNSFPSPGGLLQRTIFSSGALNSHQDEVRNLCDDTATRIEADATTVSVKNGLGAGCNNSFVNSKSKKKKKTKHFSGQLSSVNAVKGDGAPSVNTASSTKQTPEAEHRSVFDQLKRKGDQVNAASVELDTGGIGSSADTPETPSSQGQQPSKKAKVSKQASDLNPEAAAAAISTAATQSGSLVANTSSTSKLLRQNSNRDRNRKTKSTKVPLTQPAGIGIPWSTIEDQAIFALVHDLGPNWELVSDVLSSSSQLKGIFRKPKQCKERYKSLLDRMSVGEGGDSPEDPSTSQPHPSTLPGIPKGSARVLLQRIQGPMEEDTLKVHLEHIVRVVHKFRALKPPTEEQKLLVQPHASHLNAITQFCANGYPTPSDLCEITAAAPELGGPAYQLPGQHLPGVLAAGSGIRPATNGLPVLPSASNLHMGVPAVAPSTTAASAARDAAVYRDVHRLAAIRPFSPEDAQRVRYHRAMAAARGLSVSGPTVTAGLPMMGLPSPSDCPVPLLGSGNNNIGMMGGISRGMSLSRPGLPGMGSPGVPGIGPPPLGSVLSTGGVGIVSAGPTVGPTVVPQQVNLIRRSREQQLVRPGRSNEDQRRFIEELKHQAAQGNTQAATALSSLGSEVTREMMAVQAQPFQQLQHQNHQQQQQQQQYLAARMAKERQMQQQQKQRLLQQQLQQPQQPSSLQPQLQTQMQQQQMHGMSQQHVLPQQSHLSQQQHLLSSQQHNLQKQQSQQGPQQTGTLSSPSLQPTTIPSMQSNHQQHQTLLQPQQQAPPLGQVQQLPVQSKLQPPKQAQKHPHLQQASQVVQQQPPRGSKGVVRGNMLVQALPGSGQSSMLPGNVSAGSQPQQVAGQQIAHSMQGQRHLMPLAKPLSQTSTQVMTGQSAHMQAQQNQSMAGPVPQGSLGGSQKVVSQQPTQLGTMPSKQLQPSPLPSALPSQQQSPAPPLPTQQQQTSPPAAQQPQIGSSQQLQVQQRRPSQQAQIQSAQRRIQQRQPVASVGAPMIGVLGKNGSSTQQGQVPAQMSSQPGHVTYTQGSSMAVPMSMMSASSGASGLSSSGSPSSSGVHSTPWKPGQVVSPMSSGFYNLSRSGSPGAAQLPSIVSSSGMHLASSNGNSGMSITGSGPPHGVIVGSLSQPLQVGSGGHGLKMGLVTGSNPRGVSTTLQGGTQRSIQHHGNLPASPAIGATQQVRSPVPASSAGMMPVSALGTNTVAGVSSSGSMAYQANSSSLSGHSTAISNSMHMFSVQPRQSHAGSAAATTPAVPMKSPPTSGTSQTSAVSPSSPAPVIPASNTISSSVAEPSPP